MLVFDYKFIRKAIWNLDQFLKSNKFKTQTLYTYWFIMEKKDT